MNLLILTWKMKMAMNSDFMAAPTKGVLIDGHIPLNLIHHERKSETTLTLLKLSKYDGAVLMLVASIANSLAPPEADTQISPTPNLPSVLEQPKHSAR